MPQPRRIAFIDDANNVGGGQKCLLSLIDNLPREKFLPILIVSRNGAFTIEASRHDVIVQLCVLPRFLDVSWLIGTRKLINPFAICWDAAILLYAGWKLSLILRRENIDFVHTNTVFAHIYGGLAAQHSRLPCVWNFHDLIEVRRLRGAIALVWRLLARLLAARVVADSEEALRALSVGSRGSVIYVGSPSLEKSVQLPRSLREHAGLSKKSKTVLYIGRIAYSKGLDILVRAAQIVTRYDPDVHFVVFGNAGHGDRSYEQYLGDLIEQLGIAPNWHWLGYDSRARDWVADSTLLTLPSRREAMSLVLVEAGFAKKAVVATRVGGIPEVVIDGQTGVLVAPEDPQALAQALRRLLDAPELAQTMGLHAYSHVSEKFSMSRYKQAFVALYDSLGQS